MLIFEALDALQAIVPSIKPEYFLFSSHQDTKVQIVLKSVMLCLNDRQTYQGMTVPAGRRVARSVLNLMEEHGHLFDEPGAIVLNHLACQLPETIEGLYARLLTRQLGHFSGSIFRLAPDDIRDQVIAGMEQAGFQCERFPQQHSIEILAWIGDSTVQMFFATHLLSRSTTQVLSRQHMYAAGWELRDGDRRHDLYYQSCLALIPQDQDEPCLNESGAVAFPSEQRCGSCGRHLLVILDCHLEDPVLHFLDIQGKRLCVALCPTCTIMGELVYIDIDWDGAFQWSLENGEEPVEPLEDLNDWEDFPQPAYGVLGLGPARKTAYETYGAYGQEGISQVGGFPLWLQSAAYPACCSCQKTMQCLGHIQLADMQVAIDGMLYPCFCKECKKAVVVYQGT